MSKVITCDWLVLRVEHENFVCPNRLTWKEVKRY